MPITSHLPPTTFSPAALPYHLTPNTFSPAVLPYHLTPNTFSPAALPYHLTPNTYHLSPNTSRQRRVAFTLIEMLVVIVIIAILLGMSSIGFVAARNHAKRARAEVQLRELVKAWTDYYATYQKWPSSLNNQTDVIMTENNLMPLFATLNNGNANPDNTNAIPFLSLDIATRTSMSGMGTPTYCDPWGNPYKITFKTGSDQQTVGQRITVGFPNRDRYR